MEAVQTKTAGSDRAAATAARLSELRGRVDAALSSYRQGLATIQERLAEQQQAASQENSEELERLTSELRAKQQEIEDLQRSLSDAEEKAEKLQSDAEKLQSDAEKARKELEDALAQPCEECERHRQDLERSRAVLEETRSDLEQLRAENQSIGQALGNLHEQTQGLAETETELSDVTRKFELALSDVDRLKQENQRLQEELQIRPAVDEDQSRELISLQAERDELQERVSELEQGTVRVEDNPEDATDLQRRFEMAVDEVRELKRENERLREGAAKAGVSAPSVEPIIGDDWQSLKARLLASLDAEEGEGVAPERREERLKISETITATEKIVAEKDREIEELRRQLEESSSPEETARREAAAKALDEDEVVQEERERLKELQEEIIEKLRQAELDISVERARMARERAAMEEKLTELQQHSPEEEPDKPREKPKRRWLSALGISDDGDSGE